MTSYPYAARASLVHRYDAARGLFSAIGSTCSRPRALAPVYRGLHRRLVFFSCGRDQAGQPICAVRFGSSLRRRPPSSATSNADRAAFALRAAHVILHLLRVAGLSSLLASARTMRRAPAGPVHAIPVFFLFRRRTRLGGVALLAKEDF